MKRKLKAIWQILTCKGFWVITKHSKGVVKRLFSEINVDTALLGSADILDFCQKEIDCDNAIKAAQEIINVTGS